MDFAARKRYAQYVATMEHVIKRGQLYSGTLPYTHHLQDVEHAMIFHGVDDEDLFITAWLHDLVEDCPEVKFKEVEEMFGTRVYELVWAVTNEPGPNRASRHALTYPKIRTTPDAIIVKLADRLANVGAGGSLTKMYRKEHENFRRMLVDSATSSAYHAGVADRMWAALDALLARED